MFSNSSIYKTRWGNFASSLLFFPFIIFFLLGNLSHILWIVYDISLLFFAFIVISKYKYAFRDQWIFFFFVSLSILSLSLFIFNIILNGVELITLPRYYATIKHIILILFLKLFLTQCQHKSGKLIDKIYKFYIFTFWINVPYILWQWHQGVYIDNATGTFGYTASHAETFFWISLLILQVYREGSNKWIIIELPIMAFLAVMMGSKAFFFLLAFPVAIYIYHLRMRKFRYFLLVPVAAILLVILFSYSGFLRSFYEMKIRPTAQRYLTFKTEDLTKAERVQKLLFVVAEEDSYFFGKGIGLLSSILSWNGSLFGKPSLSHLSMTECTILIYEGGLIYYLVTILFFTLVLDNLFPSRSMLRLCFVFFTVVLLSFYACILTDARMIFILSFTVFFISFYTQRAKDLEVNRHVR